VKMAAAKWDTGVLRRASEASVPWKGPRVAMICVSGKSVRADHTVTGKREMLKIATARDLLLVAWPGEWRQDIFVIDDREAALTLLG